MCEVPNSMSDIEDSDRWGHEALKRENNEVCEECKKMWIKTTSYGWTFEEFMQLGGRLEPSEVVTLSSGEVISGYLVGHWFKDWKSFYHGWICAHRYYHTKSDIIHKLSPTARRGVIAELHSDIFTLVLRILGEDKKTHSLETLHVLDKWESSVLTKMEELSI